MFFDRLQMRCAEVGIKVTPLVRELGISSGAVGRWKSGTLPNGETLLKLASRLDCTVDYLLGRDEKKPTPETEDGRDPLGKQLNELLSLSSDEIKRAMIALLEQFQKQ